MCVYENLSVEELLRVFYYFFAAVKNIYHLFFFLFPLGNKALLVKTALFTEGRQHSYKVNVLFLRCIMVYLLQT